MALQVFSPPLSLALRQMLPKEISAERMVCAKTIFSSYPTGSLFLWHTLLGLAKMNSVRRWCFSQPCLYNERCFPVRLSAVITCRVSCKKCACPCLPRTHAASLPMASVPEGVWLPPVEGSGQERSLEVQNPTANFISHSWWTPRIVLLFCRQAVHTANIPFPLCAARRSLSQPRDAPVPQAFCAGLQKKQLLKPMTMKLLSSPVFSSSPFLYTTV